MDTATITREWVGRVIDEKFALREWLGGSESGGVFRTELEGPRAEKAAIKLIRADAADAGARYSGWASSMKLSHPHLMRVFRFGRCQIEGNWFIYAVTEFADEVLAQVLPDRAITSDEAGEMADPVVDALWYLHGRGFVHGHLKPANIMVVENRLKISGDDLHAASSFRKPVSALTAYDAPELASRPISPPADLWSFGITLVAALTQRAPAAGQAAPFEPGTIDTIAQPFGDIARHCLIANPAQRWSAEDVKRRLESDSAVPATANADKKSATGRRAALIAALAVLIVFAFILIPHRKQKPAPAAASNASTAPTPAPPPPAQSAASTTPQAPVAPAPQTAAPAPSQPAAPAASGTASPPVERAQAPQGSTSEGSVLQRIMPDVPRQASATIHGKVVVVIRVAVDASGAVSNATFESEGPSKYFARLALDAARQWKFRPAQSGGQAVPGAWNLRFEFRQSGTEATPEPRHG